MWRSFPQFAFVVRPARDDRDGGFRPQWLLLLKAQPCRVSGIVTLDAELAAQLRRDYTQAKLDAADRVMLEYTAKLTHHPAAVTPGDLEHLRSVGFSDRGILQINLIANWFNYINRVADGLGVGGK